MNLLFDANISWRIKSLLTSEFDNVNHITDFFEHNQKDYEIWEFAKKQNFIIVTNDSDFQNLLILNGFPPKIILLKIGNQSTKSMVETILKNKIIIEESLRDPSLGILELR